MNTPPLKDAEDWPSEQVPEPIIFREDILKIHTLYLEKLESMKSQERVLFLKYLDHLSQPIFNGEVLQSFARSLP